MGPVGPDSIVVLHICESESLRRAGGPIRARGARTNARPTGRRSRATGRACCGPGPARPPSRRALPAGRRPAPDARTCKAPTMSERFDVVVVGLGPGGEVAAGKLLEAGRHIAVVEHELIGGECAYWACIPSKTLLRATEVQGATGRVAGMAVPTVEWPALRDYRDYMVRHLDDATQVDGYRGRGATVVKGTARLDGPGRVVVGDEVLEADDVVIATGSEPIRPPIEGLGGAEVWTNRDATSSVSSSPAWARGSPSSSAPSSSSPASTTGWASSPAGRSKPTASTSEPAWRRPGSCEPVRRACSSSRAGPASRPT